MKMKWRGDMFKFKQTLKFFVLSIFKALIYEQKAL